MNFKSRARKKVAVVPNRLTLIERGNSDADPPCFSEKISALAPTNRNYMRKQFKATLLNLEEAKRRLTAYREDEEYAFETLSELTFLIDDLFASCIDLIQFHPGIDDLGDGVKVRPQHQSFDQRKAYGKVYLVEEFVPSDETA